MEGYMRTEWVEQRSKDSIPTQIYYGQQGVVTEEMEFVARCERLSAETIRDEVARGRMIIPANIHHTNLEPTCIGVASSCKVNGGLQTQLGLRRLARVNRIYAMAETTSTRVRATAPLPDS